MNRDVVLAEWRRSTQSLRAADYDAGISFSTEESRFEYQRAREFVERIRHYLSANGLSEQELADG